MSNLKSLTARIERLETERSIATRKCHTLKQLPRETQEQAFDRYTRETGNIIGPDDDVIVFKMVEWPLPETPAVVT